MVKKQPSLIDEGVADGRGIGAGSAESVASIGAGDSAQTGAVDPTMKFETALRELEELVRAMENGDLPLEESIAAYRRGSLLVQHCRQQLTEAERKIQILSDGELRDFTASERSSS